MSKDNGGPAFPGDDYWTQGGMTLRDYFAAKALQGILANKEDIEKIISLPNAVAGMSYKFADAMLLMRER